MLLHRFLRSWMSIHCVGRTYSVSPAFHCCAQALEAENTTKHSYLLELQRTHEEERKKSRRYLHALEQDNEVRPFTW
jgi:hypothetical protein